MIPPLKFDWHTILFGYCKLVMWESPMFKDDVSKKDLFNHVYEDLGVNFNNAKMVIITSNINNEE